MWTCLREPLSNVIYMKFEQLIDIINKTHFYMQQRAAVAVDRNLTVRNWLIGFYIAEFEQNGENRAKYGERLLERIADETRSIKGLSYRNLKVFRQFYFAYPQIGQTVSAQLQSSDYKFIEKIFPKPEVAINKIRQTLSAQSQPSEKKELVGLSP